ncbi:hypothetical protein LEP1GSC008_3931 [Leptospira kirschneri serovar Bulgarica str. Nikolaevo]|uniref:Uncharacterized protein n=1 Tax=Leptospira kirschneri serovar Bulgarica str. Nikolaevo TaxID=1240687 RepID=M6F7M9_9LEPT|nr:hypothetical protein LEP1GSC008_3931 [Leptospira kirschneri serovar Bulgarica str. Nikolaevo]
MISIVSGISDMGIHSKFFHILYQILDKKALSSKKSILEISNLTDF